MNSVDFTSSGNFENGILDCFPFYKYDIRDAQRELLRGIESAIQKGKKFIIIQAPTGVGKSAISYAVLRYFDNGYVCTGTKALQEQYLGDFETLLTVKGRGNYDCLESIKDVKCDKGDCEILKKKCNRKPTKEESHYSAYFSVRDNCTKYWVGDSSNPVRCPYWEVKADALNNFAVIHNYNYILTEANYVGEFTQRKVLISDEGHNIESKIIDFIKVPITHDILDIINKYMGGHNVRFIHSKPKMINFDRLRLHAVWLKNLNDIMPNAIVRIQALYEEALQDKIDFENKLKNFIVKDEDSEKTKQDLREMADGKYKRLIDLLEDKQKIESLQEHQIAFFLKDISDNLINWVVLEVSNEYGEITRIEFQPIRINKYASDKYLRLGDINIIMSATILDPSRIASDLGIPLSEVEYFEVEPQFPAENHMIFNLGVADFGYSANETRKEIDEFFKEVVGKIDLILELYPNERGIIHCTTYDIAKYIQKYSQYEERLLLHTNKDRISKLEYHKTSTNGSVLVSPSMTEGVDLKGDYSRFQILVKVPFPDLNDERIKRRKQVDPPSYTFKTANTIIQSIGRSVRSEEDHAVTFTLDSRFDSFTRKNPDLMALYTRHVRDEYEMLGLKEFKNKDTKFISKLLKHIPRKSEKRN